MSDQPPAKTLPKARGELKDLLARSAIPVLLTVIGTVAFQSGSYLVYYYSEKNQVEEQFFYERQKDVALKQNEMTILKATDESGYSRHLHLILDFERLLTKGAIDDQKRKAFAARLRNAIEETEEHLGTIEGYAGMETTLPPNYLETEIQLSSAELAGLETALGCAEHPLTEQPAQYACMMSIARDSALAQRSLSRDSSARKVLDSHDSLVEADRELRWNQSLHKFNLLYRKFEVAMVGLVVSLCAYVLLFGLFLKSEKLRTG
jgi:hypothetical protein